MEAMSRSTDELPGSKNIVEDIHSTRTFSNSDTKSYDTTFSRNVPLACHSPYHTTPSHSRPSTPISCQPSSKDIDVDLRGIGHIPDSDRSGRLEYTISSHTEHRKHFQSSNAINFHNIDSSPAVATFTGTSYPEKGDTIMDYQDNSASSSDMSYAMGCNPNPTNVDKLLVNSSNADIFSLYDSLSGSDTSSVEEDLDLEKSADEALSQWFGISLRRLIRPIRVIYAFEQVKRQCAGILQDEGHHLPDSQDEQDDNEIEDVQMDPYDAGEGSGSTHVSSILTAKVNASSANDKRRLCDSGQQTSSSPESFVKVRGRYKKHRVEGELSCPYRKRNPIRFNVRDYEKCANTSYSTMSQLKKHLTSIHFKNDSSTRTCTRCQQQIPLGHNIIAHYEQCPFPPQPHMSSQRSDPEDGFDKEVESRLKTRGNRKVEEWVDLYKILFPDDETIPDPDFIPVVEDHEVFLKYERTKPDLSLDVDILVARQYHIPEGVRDLLARDIKNLFEMSFNNILERPMLIPRNTQSRPESGIQGNQPLESEFVHVTEGVNEMGNGSPSFDLLADTFNTPRYMSPDGSQGELQEPPGQQFLSSAEHVDLASVYATQQAITEMFGHPYPVERSSIPRFEPQPGHPYYIRPPNTYGNATTAASESMWPQGFQDRGQSSLSFMENLSLPGSMQPPVIRDTGAAEDIWSLSNYQFPTTDINE
ncbi:hypothetical protein F5Y06DRAFT_295424 [Hypoxylon sp. FL0890]|nr:hypothetical protein F5Y06DRAFT_295424 [Hypoxylon sp. FL0890]